MRKLGIVTAAIVAAVLFLLFATLPPSPATTTWGGDPSIAARTAYGAYHVHTTRSDGAGDTRAVARAAASAGLQFVIITDHGDGTRPPDPPAYIDNVLVLDGVEISTNGGHYVALGLQGPTPYPLGGEATAVVDDVWRFGGFGFAAHVDSTRPQLAWSDWAAQFEGIEWLNADSEWRNESRLSLLNGLAGYLLRPGPALARMLDRPAATLARWDQLSTRRRVISVAGHDAHGGVVNREEGRRGAIAGVPSYEASFRSFTTGAVLDAPLSGDARRDGKALLSAFRAGSTFTTIDGTAAPGLVDVFLQVGNGGVPMGGSTGLGTSGRLRAVASMPPGAEMAIVRNGRDIAVNATGRYEGEIAGEQGSVRVEVRPGGGSRTAMPWLLTNAIFFGPPHPAPPETPRTLASSRERLSWHVEKDAGSTATLSSTEGGAGLSFMLRPGSRQSQFVALVADLPPRSTAFDRVSFVTDSDRAARVSMQLRYPGGLRWGQSVFLEPGVRGNGVFVKDMLPADRQSGRPPDTTQARWLLFVVDLTNMAPGGSGSFSIRDVTFVRTSWAGR